MQSAYSTIKCSLPEIMQAAQNITYEVKTIRKLLTTKYDPLRIQSIPYTTRSDRPEEPQTTLKCTLRKIQNSDIYRKNHETQSTSGIMK